MSAISRISESTTNQTLERVVQRIEQQKLLDRLAGPLASGVAKLIGRGKVNDLLSGTPLGHPAHPAIVLVPVGSWISAAVLDLVGGKRARPAATTLTGFGVLAAIPAAVTGANDWADTLGGERRVGLVHALGNDVALMLFAGSWMARRQGRHAKGLALSGLGLGIATGSAWLGGHLSYAMGVGVDTTAFQKSPQEWTDVAAESEVVEGSSHQAYAGTTPVLLTRVDGQVVALADRCTHRGGPLSEGPISEGCVECPWHGSRFRLTDGAVEHGPATRPQPVLEAQVVAGRVQVRRAENRTLRTNPVG